MKVNILLVTLVLVTLEIASRVEGRCGCPQVSTTLFIDLISVELNRNS
jgi:hypothetical protein